MEVWQSYVSGPRWANVKKALYEGSAYYGLSLTIKDHDKGWIREAIYFEVSGSPANVALFRDQLISSLQEYNKR